MTLESTACRDTWEGNGAATTFPFRFRVWEPDEVAVYLEKKSGVGDIDVTSEVAVKLSSNGGTVTFSYPPEPGRTIVICRRMPFIQEDDYLNGTRFDPAEVEDRLDQDCAERQELRCRLQRAVTVPETYRNGSGTADQFWDEIQNWYNSIMSSLSESGGLANNTWITASGTPTPRELWKRFADIVNVKDYGAKGDGSANDLPAFLSAASAAGRSSLAEAASAAQPISSGDSSGGSSGSSEDEITLKGERLIYVPTGNYYLGTEVPPAAIVPGQYFTDGMVNAFFKDGSGNVTGGAKLSLIDAGTMHADALVDGLRFGLLGYIPKRPFFNNQSSVKKDINYGIQGVASDGQYLYFVGHANANDVNGHEVSNAYQVIIKFDIANRAIVQMFTFASFGHANNACWRDGKLYLPTGDQYYMDGDAAKKGAYKRIAVINANDLSFPDEGERYKTVTGSVVVNVDGINYDWEAQVSSIAWDETRNCWWGITTDKTHTFIKKAKRGEALEPTGEDLEPIILSKLVDGTGAESGELKCVGAWAIGKKAGERHNQGIGCDRGLVYFPIYRADFEDIIWQTSGGSRVMSSSHAGWHPSGAVGVTSEVSGGTTTYTWMPTEEKIQTLRSRGHVMAVWDPAVERIIHQFDLPYGMSEAEDIAFAGDALILTCASVNMYSYYVYAARHRKDIRPSLGPLVGEDNWEPGLKVRYDEQKLRIYVDCAKPPLPVSVPGSGKSAVQCFIRDIYNERNSGALLYSTTSDVIPEDSVAAVGSYAVDAVAQGQGTPGDPFTDLDYAVRVATMRDYHNVVIHIAGDTTYASISGTRSREERHNFRDFDTLILAGWTSADVSSAYANSPTYSGTNRRSSAPNSPNPVVGCLRFEGIRHVGLQDLLCRPTNTSSATEEIIHFSNCGARIDGLKFHYSKLGHAPETLIRAVSGAITIADINFNDLVRTSDTWSSGSASGTSTWYASSVLPSSGSAVNVTVVSGGALVRCGAGGILNLPGTNSASASASWSYRGVSDIAFYGAGLVVGADSSIGDLVVGGGVYYGATYSSGSSS